MKFIIAGSRNFGNYMELKRYCEFVRSRVGEFTEIVSGGARGADELGERYAKDLGIPCSVFQAGWDLYGESAGPRRNWAMAEYADGLIAFWDGKSLGTKNMIDNAASLGLRIFIYRTDKQMLYDHK